MTIYHFCARRHVRRILREGLTRGALSIPMGRGFLMMQGWTWLTLCGNPNVQSWATQNAIDYDRTAYRLTIELPDEAIPNLYDRDRLEKEFPGSALLFDGWAGSENWRAYKGRIPLEWIKETVMKEEIGGAQ